MGSSRGDVSFLFVLFSGEFVGFFFVVLFLVGMVVVVFVFFGLWYSGLYCGGRCSCLGKVNRKIVLLWWKEKSM